MLSDRETKYWLMKAEPNSRIVKGKDVKVSSTNLMHVGFLSTRLRRPHQV